MLSALCPMRMASRLSYILLGRSSGVRPLSSLVHRPSSLLSLLSSVILLLGLTSCGGGGGGGGSTPTNVGGGYTLQVSGGTLNDGTGVNGLVILATLRDSEGMGPGMPWTITITQLGTTLPQIPLTVEYNDFNYHSYMGWEWSGIEPVTGDYRATATNGSGSVSIYYDFHVDTASFFTRPAVLSISPSGSTYTLSWNSVPNASSYSYEVYPPSGSGLPPVIGYTTTTSVALSGLSATGDYLVWVRAYASDRTVLETSSASAPSIPSQENISEYTFTFPVGGDQTSTDYSFSAAGGYMDYGLTDPSNNSIYGMAIWTSIQDITASPTGPAGNWNVKVKKQDGTIVANFIYPAGVRHYAYWFYDIEPAANTLYTVEATYGSISGTAAKTASFNLTTTARLPLPTSISAALDSITKNITITWGSVSGAQSYYVNLWAYVTDPVTNQLEYSEVWSKWTNTTSVTITQGDQGLPAGLSVDIFVTAHELDMSNLAPPAAPPADNRADMSENYTGVRPSFVTQ